jgi:DMSO/TMAO reductase YedYZ molybdopterin-dependent catalytic subunit
MTMDLSRMATGAVGAASLVLLLGLRPAEAGQVRAAVPATGDQAQLQAPAAALSAGNQAQPQAAPAGRSAGDQAQPQGTSTAQPATDHAQAPATAAPALRLQPLAGNPIDLTASDLQRLPRQTLRVAYPTAAADHQTSQEELSGFPLRALLDRLGLPSGHDVHGDALRLYVVAEGADGYRAVLALAELDASFTDNIVLVADRRGGQPLSANEGPLRLIVPTDKRPARWVRQLVRIYVGKAP